MKKDYLYIMVRGGPALSLWWLILFTIFSWQASGWFVCVHGIVSW